MLKFFRGTAFKVTLLLLAALIVGTAAAAGLRSGASPVNTVVSTLLTPLQRASSYVSDQLSRFSVSFRSSSYLSQELEQARKENEELREQLVGYEQAKQKNEMYQEFYGLKQEHADYVFAEASIVARDPGSQYADFTINKGSADDIKVNDAVVYGQSLVGIVVEAAPFTAKVRVLLNPEFSVGAYELRTAETGYVSTNAELALEGLCRMPDLESGTAIAPGGIICTSGITGNYPRDLHIGTVKQIKSDDINISSYAVIQPNVKFADLRDVFVITSFSGQGEEKQ